ncbi:MAG: hypothetical protein AAB458_02830 [Patescibacteria group bacterium]
MNSTLLPRTVRFPEQSYSRENPPLNRDEGERRIDELQKKIVLIDVDLQSKKVRDLGTLDALHAWRISARKAMAHYRLEVSFLRQWVKSQKFSEPSDPERLEEFNGLVSNFLVGFPYTRLRWNRDHSKEPTTEMVKRRTELLSLRGRYERFMSELETERGRLQCSFGDLKNAKARVHQVIRELEPEMSELKPTRKVALNPVPTGNPRLKSIEDQLAQLRQEIGMESAQMVVVLFGFLAPLSSQLKLKPEEQKLLTQIGEFVRLTSERRAIQFPVRNGKL